MTHAHDSPQSPLQKLLLLKFMRGHRGQRSNFQHAPMELIFDMDDL